MVALSNAENLSRSFVEGDILFFRMNRRREYRLRAISPLEKEICRGAGLSTTAPAGWGCYTAIWKLSSGQLLRSVVMCPALPVCESAEDVAKSYFMGTFFSLPSPLSEELNGE